MNALRKKIFQAVKTGDERLIRILAAVVDQYQDYSSIKRSAETLEQIVAKTKREESIPDSSNELYRLVYTSVRKQSCDEDCIKDILASCIKNNNALNVTGILIHTNDRFLQILEGSYENVSTLYNRIKDDPRHGASNMRFCEAVNERHFTNWHMAYKHLDEEIAYKTDISPEEKKLYESLINGDLSSYEDDGMRVLKSFLAVA